MNILGKVLAAVCAVLFLAGIAWGQVTITYWNFNVGTPASGAQWANPIAANTGTGSLFYDITNAQSFTGTTLNAEGSDVAGGSFCPIDQANNTKSLTLSLSTTGYTNIILSYATRGTATGFTTHTIDYSTDSSTYSNVTTITGRNSTTFSTQTVDMSSITAANNASKLFIRITLSGATSATGNNRFDNIKVQGTAPIKDGDGTGTTTNVIGSGILNNTTVFPANASGQSAKISVTGTTAGTLTTVSVTIPYQWSWTGSASDVSPAGDDGASLTSESVSGSGTSGDPYVIQYSGAITNTQVASITISNLTSGNPTALSDNGNYPFVVKTAITSGTLTAIASSPVAYVVIPISHIRNQSGGVPVLNLNYVATEGVATVASGVFSTSQLQTYIQDGTSGVNVFINGAPPTVTEGNSYIVKGQVQQYNGNTEVVPSVAADVLDNGTSSMPAYQPVTIAELTANPETYEGKYIAVQNITLNAGTWPTAAGGSGSGIPLTFTDGVGTITIYVDYDTDVDGNTEPTWPKDVKGIFAQSSSSPAYSLTPRYFASDIAPANSLPVEMSTFAVTAAHLNAQLKWSTATETNNFGFDIERKTGTTQWTKIGFVNGAGTSTSLHNYSFTDNVGQAGTYEYRIKQIDKGGAFKYSSVMQVEVGAVAKVLSLGANYPNPFNPSTSIEFTVPTDGRVVLKIYNMIGQEVATLFDGIATAGTLQKATFDASRLPSGVYFSRMEFGTQALVKRMLLVK